MQRERVHDAIQRRLQSFSVVRLLRYKQDKSAAAGTGERVASEPRGHRLERARDQGGLDAVARHELPERLYRRIAGARWQRPEVCDQLRRQFSSPVDAPADLGTKKY